MSSAGQPPAETRSSIQNRGIHGLSTTATTDQLLEYCQEVAQKAQAASRELVTVSTELKNRWLVESAEALLESVPEILAANELDLTAAPGFGLTDASIDRLRLDQTRIEGIAQALRDIAALPDPIGETIEGHVRPNGLEIRKVRVPLGTVFFIYESRPNVTVDAAAICMKSGNAVILRGGKEAQHSSRAFVDILNRVAKQVGLPDGGVQLVSTTDRAAVGHFLALGDWIDVAIPRGGKGLIERVASEATMPVIKHFDGNCHAYIDEAADPRMAVDIVVNSKCQRMGVCNTLESLVVHQTVAERLLPAIETALKPYEIELRGDSKCCDILDGAVPADASDWGTEYLGPILSVRVVDNIDDAIAHINQYSSKHTETIVTTNIEAASKFQAKIDSSAVIVNASTRFNDGGEFGLGAEIGISTDKFHARGPCGLKELTTYKYLVNGSGQCR